MKGKFTAVLFILVFILIAAGVFAVLSELDSMRPAEPASSGGSDAYSVVSPDPVSTPFALPTPTPLPTVIVNATPVPAATPAPTPLPVSTPYAAPVQTTLATGSFSSDTGTWLNITADWSVKSLNQEQVQVTVSVSAVSYALQTQALSRTLNISLDGQYVSLDAPAINYTGESQVASSLGTQNFTVDLPANSSKALALQVEWQFGGTYGGPNGTLELPVLECGGAINVAR